VLHHLPSESIRLRLLKKIQRLLKPGGKFILSNWQFLNSDRLKARLQGWEVAGLSAEQVDDDDYLLDWRAGGTGLRYAHHFSEAELSALAAGTHFHVMETFYSDGHNHNLGLYQIWGNKSPA
jgi:SAM-dependent methyltransferase